MIRPLIVDEGKWRGIAAVAAFTTGAVLSSATTGALLGLFGDHSLPHLSLSVPIGLAFGLLLAVADVVDRTPTIRRQTKRAWWRMGPVRASALWGVDLGLGFSTIRVTSLYWVAAAGVVLLRSPTRGAVVLSTYGFGLAVGLAVGVFVLRGRAGECSANVQVLRVRPGVTVALAALVPVFTIALAVAAA